MTHLRILVTKKTTGKLASKPNNENTDKNKPKSEKLQEHEETCLYMKENGSTGKTINIMVAHKLLGHPNEAYVWNTSKKLGWKLEGKWKCCEACSIAKAKAKLVRKTTSKKAEKPGERIYVDTSGPYNMSTAGNKCWVMVVDEATKMKWSRFIPNKRKIGDAIEPKIA